MYRNQYYLTVDILQVVCFCYATASLVVKPSNTSASEGQRVQLNCSTDLDKPISWQYIIPGESPSLPKDLFFTGQFINGYGARYEMRDDKKKEGVYDLIIPSAQLSDTGIYRCRDDDGRLEHKDAILSITVDPNNGSKTTVQSEKLDLQTPSHRKNDGSETTVQSEKLDLQTTSHRKNDGSETTVQSEKLDLQTTSHQMPSCEDCDQELIIIAGVEGSIITVLVIVVVALAIHLRRRNEAVANKSKIEMQAKTEAEYTGVNARIEPSHTEYQDLKIYEEVR